MSGIRGDLLVVDNPGIDEFFSEETGLSPDLMHIYPFADHVIIGGTAIADTTDVTPDPSIAAAILARCAAVFPELRNSRVREHRVGVRPSRPVIRLEQQTLDNGSIVAHNYGHSGSGVTLSWGCAETVLATIRS